MSRRVLIHQTQDQGVEAVRPGAGRDEDDQYKNIQDIGKIEPIADRANVQGCQLVDQRTVTLRVERLGVRYGHNEFRGSKW